MDVYVGKWKKHFKSKTATKRWMTRAQVKAHFIEEEVANAVCDAAETRKNPDPSAAKLEAGNQFHVTIFDDSFEGEEQGEEGGIDVTAELGKVDIDKDKMKKLLAGFDDGASGRGGPIIITEEEGRLRQERKGNT